jgi:DNA-binding IclR family transcriptional regulator
MESNQIILLTDLAKRTKAEKKNKKRVVATLQSAKILTKSGNFTTYFSNLNKVVSSLSVEKQVK